MAELIITGDVEGAAVAFLRTGLNSLGKSATVATKVPTAMPDSMVRVSLTGGLRENMVTDRPQLTVECWSSSTVTASDLARTCHGLMHSAAGFTVGTIWVRRAEDIGGVQFFPDPDTAKARYQFTVRWFVRGTAF